MECKNCPNIKEELDVRISRYQEYIEKHGIPNDVYGYCTLEDIMEYSVPYCWCEKTGGKIWWYGQCDDAHVDVQIHKNSSKKKRRNKIERDLKHKNHLKYLAENTSYYPQPAYYVDEIYIKGHGYMKNPKPYYKRLYRGKCSKYHKKQSNRRIRRYKGELHNGWSCHKLYDFWWEMY